MLDERQETGENTGTQLEQFSEPTIWDFIAENSDDKYIHLKVTPGTETHKMLNFVALHLPDLTKTQVARLLIKIGFKVFLHSLRKGKIRNETK